MNSLIKICIEKIKDELLLFSVIAILVIVSFPIAKTFVLVVYIIGVILYSIMTYIKLLGHENSPKFLDNFEIFLKTKGNWEKRQVDKSEVYFYKNNNNYKIETSNEIEKEWTARESWMENFPDPHISEWKVYLKYGESKIAEFSFLSCDGGRYFLPIPEKRCLEKGDDYRCLKFEYFWNKNSIEYKLGEVIGDFYRGKNLKETAKFCDIKIEESIN